ncbi:MAG TPA: hypothetical protein VMZ50_04715 [Phycisphaerae bacterium]|nr:hypothetical protein [Phycisphaerae bacterium]
MAKTRNIPLPIVRPHEERMRELQQDLLDLARTVGRVEAKLMQIAAEIPGGAELDVPGSRPRNAPRRRPSAGHRGRIV